MKLIINIDEETYEVCKAWAKTATVFSAETKAIANGTPYEERPQGKWIKINPETRGYAEFFRCSNCLSNVQLSYWGKECEYDYCPNCGADMRGGS